MYGLDLVTSLALSLIWSPFMKKVTQNIFASLKVYLLGLEICKKTALLQSFSFSRVQKVIWTFHKLHLQKNPGNKSKQKRVKLLNDTAHKHIFIIRFIIQLLYYHATMPNQDCSKLHCKLIRWLAHHFQNHKLPQLLHNKL